MTGIMPSRTSVSVTARDGLTGTIPGANERAAGVMTAEQADQLSRLWSKFMTSRGDTVMSSVANANWVTTEQLQESIDAVQKYVASRPAIAASKPEPLMIPAQPQIVRVDAEVREQVAEMRQQIQDLYNQVSDAQRRVGDVELTGLQKASVDHGAGDVPSPFNDPDDDALPSFLRRPESTPTPQSVPAVDLSPIIRELEALKFRLAGLETMQQQQEAAMQQPPVEPPPLPTADMGPPAAEPDAPIDIKASAIADIQAAGYARRASAVPHGFDDPALALNLATIAHLARSGQEGAFTVLAALAEAKEVALWQDVADELIGMADAALRIAVRTYAVELMALRELGKAKDATTAAAITGAAIETIRAIEG